MIRLTTVATMPIDPQRAKNLAAAAKHLADWRAKRDHLIWDAHQNGASLREIAAAVKMTNPGVLSVIRRIENQREWQRTQEFTDSQGNVHTFQNKRLPAPEVDEERWPL